MKRVGKPDLNNLLSMIKMQNLVGIVSMIEHMLEVWSQKVLAS